MGCKNTLIKKLDSLLEVLHAALYAPFPWLFRFNFIGKAGERKKNGVGLVEQHLQIAGVLSQRKGHKRCYKVLRRKWRQNYGSRRDGEVALLVKVDI